MPGESTRCGEAARSWMEAGTDGLRLEINLFRVEPEASREDTDFGTISHAPGCCGVSLFSNAFGSLKDHI